MLELISLYNDNIPPVKQVCVVDGKPVDHPKDLITIGIISSDISEPISKYNFTHINRKNLHLWQGKDEFINLATKFLKDNKWESLTSFNYLDYIIDQITSAD